MLEDLLDLELISRQAFPHLTERLQSTIDAMADALEAILHPDGQIPLLGDSAFDATPHPRILLDRAPRPNGTNSVLRTRMRKNSPPPSPRRVGDYWIYRDTERFLIFDAGPVGPDHLPAHGHADLLTIEASIGQQRLFVDSGTCCYEPGTIRDYCRSTPAHNTLEINQRDQCDMWSSFRMGYRGHPLAFDCGQQGQVAWARASHDAYRRVGVPRVTRWIAVVEGHGLWLCVDLASGRGLHRFDERLHLHPGVTAEVFQHNLVRLSAPVDLSGCTSWAIRPPLLYCRVGIAHGLEHRSETQWSNGRCSPRHPMRWVGDSALGKHP